MKKNILIIIMLLITSAYVRCQSKPNIIFILADDLGYMDVGFNGNQYYQTPNIDRLASQGMIFTNAYANASNCAPTRASLMSGQYSVRHGVYTVGNPARGKSEDRKLVPYPNNDILASEFYTMAEMLKNAGYVTGHIGKWHLGSGSTTGPTGQGFDVNIGGSSAGSPKSYFSPYNMAEITNGPDGEYLTDRLSDEALSFIENNQNNPFFLYLPHYAVHAPIQGKSDLTAKYESILPSDLSPRNPTYAGMVESLDQGVGKILDKLDELNLTDNTIVIFFSDNGGKGTVTSHYFLRGYKGSYYEGGMREPMTIRWPGKIAAGSTCDVPIIGIDFYPTLMNIVGGSVPNNYTLDGVDITPLLEQTGTINRDAIFFHAPFYLEEYIPANGRFRCTPCSVVRKGKYKLIQYYETNNIELFNLDEDISEQHDSAEYLPQIVNDLKTTLVNWQTDVNAPVQFSLNSGYGDLIEYHNFPKNGEYLEINHGNSYKTQLTGTCLSNEIEYCSLEIYHDAKLFSYSKTPINVANGTADFTFDVDLPQSASPYKLKIRIKRFPTDEVNLIVDNLIVGEITSNKVEIDEPVVFIGIGDSKSLTSTMYPLSDLSEVIKTWSSEDNNVVSVTNDGVITGVSEGKTFVVLNTDTKGSDSCWVEVQQTPVIASEMIVPNSVNLMIGDQVQVSPVFLPANVNIPTVNWSSNDENVATVIAGLIEGKSKGNTNIAVSTGNPIFNQTVQVNVLEEDYTLEFDGTDYVDCGSYPQIEGLGALTIESWIYLTGSGYMKVFNYGSGSNRVFMQENNGKIHMRVGHNGTEISTMTTSNVLTTNTWVHVAAVYNGSLNNADCVKLYLNGVPQTTSASGTNPGTSPSAGLNAYIGALTATSGNFNGRIDELRVWNTALSESQLNAMMDQRIYNNSGNVYGQTDHSQIAGLNWNNLIGYYQMMPGTDVADASSSNTTGINHGAEYVLRDGASTGVFTSEIILPEYIYLQKGETQNLSPVIYPAEAKDNNIIYVSENSSIASVSNGQITGNLVGKTYVTAYAEDTGASDMVPIIVSQSTGINESSYHKLFTLFPNPSADMITIKGEENITKIKVSNLSGRSINVPVKGDKLIVEALPKGIYFVEINDKYVLKFIKK